jgi:lactoylglutathione lyase
MKIDHIALWVTNLEGMKQFYTHYFGAVSNEKYINTTKQFESYFLSFETGARLELMKMSSIPPTLNDCYAQFSGLIHFAVSVGSEEQVNSLTEKFRKDGYQIMDGPRWTGDGYYESVVLDPEKNRIEITI